MTTPKSPCPFCGEVHATHAETFEKLGFEAFACDRIPEGHIYLDDQPEVGPRGQLVRLPKAVGGP